MRKRVRATILTLCLAGTLSVAPATPANAAMPCDELSQPLCTAGGAVCTVLYKLHVNDEPGCMG